MTEKRFTMDDDGFFYDDHRKIILDTVLKVLNELNDENIILKSELSFSQNQNRELRKVLKDNRSMAEVVEENNELKLKLGAFKDKLCELGVSDVKLYGKRYYTGLEEGLE